MLFVNLDLLTVGYFGLWSVSSGGINVDCPKIRVCSHDDDGVIDPKSLSSTSPVIYGRSCIVYLFDTRQSTREDRQNDGRRAKQG